MAGDELLPPSDPQEAIEQLRAQIAELRRELEVARATAGADAASAAEVSELRRQLEDAQRELAELRAVPNPAPRGRRLDGFFEVED